MKKFHITWFIDEKKDKLSGLTIEAEDIASAINQIIKARIPIKDGGYVTAEVIKYAIEI